MRIAQVAPLIESVPPKLYGGTERVVSYLTEELVRQGHQVTLFAAGDSQTSARLVPGWPEALRLARRFTDPVACHLVMLERLYRMADEFDILHFHIDYLHYPVSRRQQFPHVTTLHGRLDLPELPAIYGEFPEMPVVSISNAQRKPLPQANWAGTVYHGLPRHLHGCGHGAGGYLAFLGRMSPEKRPDRAIEIAKRVGMPLKLAAKVDRADRDYFEQTIRPLLDHPLIEYVGEVNERQKTEFLGQAAALLFPIDWPEPFGLVMVEAMACGTPVVGWHCGSVPEVIDEGVTGCIVESLDAAVAAVERAVRFDRRRCRQRFEERFAVERMAAEYVQVYERMVTGRSHDLQRQADRVLPWPDLVSLHLDGDGHSSGASISARSSARYSAAVPGAPAVSSRHLHNQTGVS